MNSKSAEMASHSGHRKTPSEMRIILLGHIGSGKSSSGNTILGSEQFSLERTDQCEKRQGDVGGRQVTVVNTPGWFMNQSLNETSELIKQDIVLSASLCPTGPHALLLVIRAGTSRKADWYKNMEEHVQLLSQTVWSHTMILFSMGDYLGGKSIEQYIESEGEGLQRLVKKCGNRYHVFNNKNRGDDTQVTQLLDKIQEVAGDKGGCFEIDRRVLEETKMKRRTQDEGAARRQMKVKKQRESIRSMMGDDLHLSEMRIILLGPKWSGKSSSGNTILGSEQFSLERTVQCEKRQGDVGGRQVTVVNTPGWWKVHPLNETPELIKQQIARSASLCPPGPHGLLLVIRAGESCTADECKNMEEHMQILSQRVWSHTMILFTHGDFLRGKSIEQYIESEGEGLQRLVKKCGNRYHVFNNENRGDDTRVTELLLKIEEMDHYGTGRPATPDTKPKAVQHSPVPAESKGTASCVPGTSLSLDTLRNTKEIEDCKRRQHQLDQDQQELRNQHPVLVGRVKNLTAQFEASQDQRKEMQRDLEKIRQRQTEADKKQVTSLALDVTQKATIKEQQQQKVNEDQQDQINKLTDAVEKLGQKQTEADQKRSVSHLPPASCPSPVAVPPAVRRSLSAAGASEAPQHLTHGEAEKKLLSVREQFLKKISESTLHSLLDKLLTKSVITDDEMEAAMGEKLRKDKARYVIDMVRRKGDEASSFMLDMISQLDRNLSDALQLKPSLTD